jgi:4-amino-4-deoxy-L-arabinose transferase-like glycosyltransferase
LAGSIVYVLPFLLAEAPATGAAGDAGLLLVFRENVVRYFAPFDHDAPFYMYFPWLQVLWFPWLPVLWGGIAAIFINYKSHSEATRWLIAAFTAIFLFFLLSGSRRIYYILPLLPYCALLIALFLQREDLARLRAILLRVQAALLLFAIVLLIALPALALLLGARAHIAIPANFSLRSATIIGAIGALYWLMAQRIPVLRTIFALNDQRYKLAALLGVAAVLLGGFFLQLRVLQDGYRTEWPFARELKVLAQPLPAAQIAAVSERVAGGLLYYAELPVGLSVFKTPEEIVRFTQSPPYPKLILASTEDFAKLPPELLQLTPILAERLQPWEKPHKAKMRAWLIESALK